MVQAFRDFNRRYYVQIKEGHKYIHLLTMAQGSLEVMKVGQSFMEQLSPSPETDAAIRCARVWDKSFQSRSPAADRAIKTLLGQPEEDEVPPPETKSTGVTALRVVTLQEICSELGIEPGWARKILRGIPELKPQGTRWAWEKPRVIAKVKKALRT